MRNIRAFLTFVLDALVKVFKIYTSYVGYFQVAYFLDLSQNFKSAQISFHFHLQSATSQIIIFHTVNIMPPRNRKAVPKKSVGQHPQIEELPSLQAFEKYVGHADIPKQPLVDRIAQLQAERDARLNQHSHPTAQKSGSSASDEVPKRYRKPGGGSSANNDSVISQLDPDADLTPAGQAMFSVLDYSMYLIPILSVHLVLDILVRVQYSEDTFEGFAQRDVLYRTATAIPVFAILHHFVHPLRHTRVFRIASFFASVAAGGYLLYASNEEGYYYVMKRAPPLGTLWVWMFVEMEWEWSLTSLAVVLFWMWLRDYSL